MYGTIDYEFKLSISASVDGQTTTKTFKAELFLNEAFELSNISDFIAKIKTAIATAIKFQKKYSDDGIIELSASLGKGCGTLEQPMADYQRWYTDDITDLCAIKGEESLYLRPDTRYVDGAHDMLLSARDPLEGLTC